jgi:DNA-binding response OmpR family regulator
MRLLIVEDEDSIRSAMVRALIQAGHAVSAAPSLAAARTILAELPAERRPQALLSDLKLPDGSGLDLAAELGLPFVLMSGFAGFDDAVQALRLGCVDFFTKPVAIREIRRALTTIERRLAQAAPPIVADPAGPWVMDGPDGPSLCDAQVHVAAWRYAEQAPAAVQCLWPGTSLVLRRVMAELATAVPAGRLVWQRRSGTDSLWLAGATLRNDDRARTLTGLARLSASPAGLLATLPVQAADIWQPSRERHWPGTLPDTADWDNLACLGSWAHAALRADPPASAPDHLAAELAAAGIRLAAAGPGVGRAERAALFG